MNGFIYKIFNSINDKIYIGKTLSTIEKRFAEHQRDALKPEENNRPLYRAMRKYGPENFFVELIETAPLENLSEREKYWIDYYKCREIGLNKKGQIERSTFLFGFKKLRIWSLVYPP